MARRFKYVVRNESADYEWIDEFDTLKEARDFIKGLKEFDKEEGNPFDEHYIIEKEE